MRKPKLFGLSAAALAAASMLALTPQARAADHGDAPALAQDQGADIADVFLFLDPNDNDKVVLIGTFHGFITPGESVNFGVFDPNVRYRFNIYNDHVNLPPPVFGSTKSKKAQAKDLAKVVANRTIDVTFTPRVAAADATGPSNAPNSALPVQVRRPSPQLATITLGGFSKSVKTKSFSGKPTTPATLSTTPAPQALSVLSTGAGDIDFFAGIVDDPFFFDIPAFSALIESFRVKALNPSTPINGAALGRGRDTFAGYNVLSIALRIPKSLLVNSDSSKTIIGADFTTQRHITQVITNNGAAGLGAFKGVDRMGNPGINVALIGFNDKNAYNAASPKVDASLKFALSDIIPILGALGVTTGATPPDPYFAALASIAVTKGDILQLDTSVANSGPNGGNNALTGFGKINPTTGQVIGGRRLTDDTIDTILTAINKGAPLGDNVGPNQDGFLPTDQFPFLHTPHQPLPRLPGDPTVADTNVDDGTRN